jgi:AcrR family transcriptional regulator
MMLSMPKVVDADLRRHDLAAAAARVIARAGLTGANLRDVAAEAGMTTGALTHYFSDKRELLIFTLRASLGRRAKVSLTDDAHDALRSILEGALPVDDDSRLHWVVSVAFCAQAAGDDDLAVVQRDFYRDYRARVVARLEAALADGFLRFDGDPAAEADRLIALVDGIAFQAMLDPDSWPPARQRQLLDEALAALAA